MIFVPNVLAAGILFIVLAQLFQSSGDGLRDNCRIGGCGVNYRFRPKNARRLHHHALDFGHADCCTASCAVHSPGSVHAAALAGIDSYDGAVSGDFGRIRSVATCPTRTIDQRHYSGTN